jgi:hypothetical protein
MEQLGWMLALGPILCAGILIAGVLAGKLSDS